MDVLFFDLPGSPCAIALESVADVAPAGPIHPVPLAPPAVLGLAEQRGRAIAVIDLPSLLDVGPIDGNRAAHVLRLAPPLAGAAFWVPVPIGSGHGTPASPGHVWIDGRLHALLDAEALVKRAGSFH